MVGTALRTPTPSTTRSCGLSALELECSIAAYGRSRRRRISVRRRRQPMHRPRPPRERDSERATGPGGIAEACARFASDA